MVLQFASVRVSEYRFYSKLVRLKVGVFSVCHPMKAGFYSKLVRLKGLRVIVNYDDAQFLFQTGAIKS